MKRLALRSMFALAMVTCLLSSTQAGIIPWVYDTIFGPVRYPAYGPGYGYGASYAPQMNYGNSPYGQCSPCASNVGYARPASPCATGRCSTGGCPTTVAYYPAWPMGYRVVSSQCSPCSTTNLCSTKKTDWRASDTVDRKAPEPRDESKTTYADEEKDPFGAQKPPRPLAEETPVKPEGKTAGTGGEAVSTSVTDKIKKDGWEETSKSSKTAGGESKPGEVTGEDAKAAAAAAEEVVAPAKAGKENPGETPAEEVKTNLIGEGAAGDDLGAGKTTREGESKETPAEAKEVEGDEAKSGETKPLEVLPLDVKPLKSEQDKAAWKISRPVRRIAFRASFGNVKVARVSRSVEADYIIPAASLTRIAER